MADFIPPAHNSASPFADMRGHHVALRTRDLDTAKRWYVDTLDFRVIAEWDFADERLAYLAPPSRMDSRGFAKDALKVGATATLVGYPHKTIADEMRAERITIGGKTIELR